MRGHQAARLDPLGLAPIDNIPDLDPAHHGLGPEDLETVFNTGTLASGNDRLPLREIIKILNSVYPDPLGAQYMYMTDTSANSWVTQRLESAALQTQLPHPPKHPGSPHRVDPPEPTR